MIITRQLSIKGFYELKHATNSMSRTEGTVDDRTKAMGFTWPRLSGVPAHIMHGYIN